MAKAELAPLLEERGNESDKQFLIELKKNGHIAKQELRILARELDESGDLEAVIRAFDAGEIEIPRGKKGSRDYRTLEDVPDNASAKEMVAWLFRREAITKGQARKAAEIIDGTKVRPEDDREFVRTVLRRVGAHSVLKEEPDPEAPEEDVGGAEGGEETPQGGQEGTGEAGGTEETGEGTEGGENGEEGGQEGGQEPTGGEGTESTEEDEPAEDDEDEPEPQWPDPEQPMTSEGLYAMNAEDAGAYIELVEDVAALGQLHAWERGNPNYSGGRVGVLTAIEERRDELTTSTDED